MGLAQYFLTNNFRAPSIMWTLFINGRGLKIKPNLLLQNKLYRTLHNSPSNDRKLSLIIITYVNIQKHDPPYVIFGIEPETLGQPSPTLA